MNLYRQPPALPVLQQLPKEQDFQDGKRRLTTSTQTSRRYLILPFSPQQEQEQEQQQQQQQQGTPPNSAHAYTNHHIICPLKGLPLLPEALEIFLSFAFSGFQRLTCTYPSVDLSLHLQRQQCGIFKPLLLPQL